jgi:hypothetical protein
MPGSLRRALCLAVEFRQRLATVLGTFVVILAGVACGGGNDSGGGEPGTPPAQTPPGTAISVRGTERLAWEQSAPSYQQLLNYSFTAYVDGTRAGLTGVECGQTATSDGFRCSAALPAMSNGTHTIQITAVVAGAESARSASITVTMNQGRMVVEAANRDDQDRAAAGGSVCVDASLCLARHHEVTRPLPLSSPAGTPDGRLLFVEDGRTVRVRAGGGVTNEPALDMTGTEARIVALLIDPEFERTRFVRVAWTEQHPTRGRVLKVARMRELNDRLGEMAVIIPEIPVGGDGSPHVIQDSGGRIYITLPAPDDAGRATDPYAGQILGFTADGRSATDGPTPIIGRGYDRPDAFAFDTRTQRLWLSGSTREFGHRLMSMAPGDGHPEQQTSGTQTVAPGSSSTGLVGFAPLGSIRAGEVPAFLALDEDGTLTFVRAEAEAFVQQSAVPLDAGRLMSLDADGGRVFVTAASAGDSGQAFSIYRLEPHAR